MEHLALDTNPAQMLEYLQEMLEQVNKAFETLHTCPTDTLTAIVHIPSSMHPATPEPGTTFMTGLCSDAPIGQSPGRMLYVMRHQYERSLGSMCLSGSM